MLILKAFALSFVILVPRLLIVPLLVIAYVLASIVLGVVFVLLFFVSPPLAFIVTVLLSLAFATIPMMIGCRLGLGVRRHKITGSYGDLILPGIIYGGIEALGLLVIAVAGAAVFVALSPGFGVPEIQALIATGDEQALAAALEAGGQMAIVILVLGFVAVAALRAALLVPMTGAAAGRDAGGQLHTPLTGFGKGVVPLTVLVVLSYAALPALLYGGMQLVTLFAGPGALDAALFNIERADQSGIWSGIGATELMMIFGGWVCWLWIFCLQCAGGVLRFEREQGHAVVHRAEAQAEQRITPDDARALWKSRMQNL